MKFVVHRLQTILTQLFKGFRFVKPFPSYTSIKFWGVAYNDSMANILFCKKWPHTLDTHDGAAVWFTSMASSCMQLTSRVPWQIWERSSVPSTKLAGHLFQRDTVFLGQLNVQLFQCAQGAAQQPSKGWHVQPGFAGGSAPKRLRIPHASSGWWTGWMTLLQSGDPASNPDQLPAARLGLTRSKLMTPGAARKTYPWENRFGCIVPREKKAVSPKLASQ